MRSWDFLRLALLASVSHSAFAEAANKPRDAVLLSKIASLTLRDGKQTSHRRVSSIPQVRIVLNACINMYLLVLSCDASVAAQWASTMST